MSVLYIILVAIYIASIVGCVHVSEEMAPPRSKYDKAGTWIAAVFWPIIALLVFAVEGVSSKKSGKFH